MIWWHGVASDDVHLIVERFPERPVAARKMSAVSIPGRNGDHIEQQDAFENVIQPYEVYLSGEFYGHLPTVSRAAARWLMVKGYQRLEDSYDMDVFRLAYIQGGERFENVLNEFGRATIEFNCKPQRFLKHGDLFRPASNGQRFINPTGFIALPQLLTHGSGAGALSLGGRTMTLSDVNETMIDCETCQVCRGTENLNDTASGAFFRLEDLADIAWTGGITGVEIRPRWWHL